MKIGKRKGVYINNIVRFIHEMVETDYNMAEITGCSYPPRDMRTRLARRFRDVSVESVFHEVMWIDPPRDMVEAQESPLSSLILGNPIYEAEPHVRMIWNSFAGEMYEEIQNLVAYGVLNEIRMTQLRGTPIRHIWNWENI